MRILLFQELGALVASCQLGHSSAQLQRVPAHVALDLGSLVTVAWDGGPARQPYFVQLSTQGSCLKDVGPCGVSLPPALLAASW